MALKSGTLNRRYALARTPTGAGIEAAVTAASAPPLSGGPGGHGSAAAHAYTIASRHLPWRACLPRISPRASAPPQGPVPAPSQGRSSTFTGPGLHGPGAVVRRAWHRGVGPLRRSPARLGGSSRRARRAIRRLVRRRRSSPAGSWRSRWRSGFTPTRAGIRRVALPDLSHLLLHEEDGPRLLHRPGDQPADPRLRGPRPPGTSRRYPAGSAPCSPNFPCGK